MRKITWVFYLLFFLALLLFLLFFRGAIPRSPQTEPTPNEQAAMIEEKDSYTLLLCDPAAARGTEFIVIDIPRQGSINALYITGDTEINGISLTEYLTDSPKTIISSLSPYITIDHYILLDMGLVDELAQALNLSDPHQQASPTQFYANILFSSGGLLQRALRVADNIQTDLAPVTALRLANQLAQLKPSDSQLLVISPEDNLEQKIAIFKSRR